MLNLEQLLEVFPAWLRIHKKHILREYLQHLLLKAIFSSPVASKLVFIGWTALRLLYNNQRFSEDLDFDNKDLSHDEFDELIHHCVQQLTYRGIEAERTATHKQAMHGYIRVPHVLTQYGLAPETRLEVQEKLMIRIDTYDQGYLFTPDRSILQWFGIQSVLSVAPLSLLMAQKILTIGQRKAAKWRDYFDLVFLMSKKVVPDYRFLEEKISITNAEAVKQWLRDAYQVNDTTLLHNDVKNFLFNPFDDSVKNFEVYVEQYQRE